MLHLRRNTCLQKCEFIGCRDSEAALSIQHMERVLGDRTFVDMMGGRQPYLVAAMKSLPLREDYSPANSSSAEQQLVTDAQLSAALN